MQVSNWPVFYVLCIFPGVHGYSEACSKGFTPASGRPTIQAQVCQLQVLCVFPVATLDLSHLNVLIFLELHWQMVNKISIYLQEWKEG